jgi:hypothetical protein
VEHLRTVIGRSELAWAAYIVAASVVLFTVAVVVGMALSALSFVWGAVVAFVLLVLVVGLLAPEVRSFWAKLPR